MKEKYITRTIKKAVIKCKGMDVSSEELSIIEKSFTITGDHSDSEYMEIIKDLDESFVPARIIEKVFTEKLYRIKESVFLQYAEEVKD